MSTSERTPETDEQNDGTERRELPRLLQGTARVAALDLVAPVSVSLLVKGEQISFAAEEALLEQAIRLRAGEVEFQAVKLPGQRPRLLRLDSVPRTRPPMTSAQAAAYVALRWAETLRRLGEGA